MSSVGTTLWIFLARSLLPVNWKRDQEDESLFLPFNGNSQDTRRAETQGSTEKKSGERRRQKRREVSITREVIVVVLQDKQTEEKNLGSKEIERQ